MIRRTVLTTLAVVVGCALPSAAAAPADAATASRVPSCSSSRFHAGLVGHAADPTQLYRFIVLTNAGGRCVLRGRAAVSMAQHGHPVGVPGDYFPYAVDARPRDRSIAVQHRGSASLWIAVAVDRGGRCRAQPVDGLLVRLGRGTPIAAAVPPAQRHLFIVCASRTSHELDFSQFLTGAHTR